MKIHLEKDKICSGHHPWRRERHFASKGSFINYASYRLFPRTKPCANPRSLEKWIRKCFKFVFFLNYFLIKGTFFSVYFNKFLLLWNLYNLYNLEFRISDKFLRFFFKNSYYYFYSSKTSTVKKEKIRDY